MAKLFVQTIKKKPLCAAALTRGNDELQIGACCPSAALARVPSAADASHAACSTTTGGVEARAVTRPMALLHSHIAVA